MSNYFLDQFHDQFEDIYPKNLNLKILKEISFFDFDFELDFLKMPIVHFFFIF